MVGEISSTRRSVVKALGAGGLALLGGGAAAGAASALPSGVEVEDYEIWEDQIDGNYYALGGYVTLLNGNRGAVEVEVGLENRDPAEDSWTTLDTETVTLSGGERTQVRVGETTLASHTTDLRLYAGDWERYS